VKLLVYIPVAQSNSSLSFSLFAGVKHTNVVCVECSQRNILGARWKCCVCAHVDLCNPCYMKDRHETGHTFIRIDLPGTTDGCAFTTSQTCAKDVYMIAFH